ARLTAPVPWMSSLKVHARYVVEDLGRGGGSGRLAREEHARARVARLSPREREVLGLVGAGLSNPEIAARLHLVEGTVKAYVSAVLDRLEVRNRVRAAIVAYEAGLVEADA
ncbi:response regulator transcription factor, partial [Streptomyces sp. NPDC005047]